MSVLGRELNPKDETAPLHQVEKDQTTSPFSFTSKSRIPTSKARALSSVHFTFENIYDKPQSLHTKTKLRESMKVTSQVEKAEEVLVRVARMVSSPMRKTAGSSGVNVCMNTPDASTKNLRIGFLAGI